MKKIITFCLSLLMTTAIMAERWILITDASQLQAGDQIVFAYVDGGITAAGSLSYNSTKSQYWINPVSSTFEGNNLTQIGEGTGVFTLEKEDGKWKFAVEGTSGKVYLGATAAKKLSYASDKNTWTIDITDGEATVTHSDYGTFMYNRSSTTNRFSNYTSTTSTMHKVQMYRLYIPPTYSLTYKDYPYKKIACEEPVYEAGTIIKLSNGKPTRVGHEFLGWIYAGRLYQPGDNFVMPDENAELVACWDEWEAIDEASVRVKAKKMIRNGQLIIVRDGVEYNVIGVRVK